MVTNRILNTNNKIRSIRPFLSHSIDCTRVVRQNRNFKSSAMTIERNRKRVVVLKIIKMTLWLSTSHWLKQREMTWTWLCSRCWHLIRAIDYQFINLTVTNCYLLWKHISIIPLADILYRVVNWKRKSIWANWIFNWMVRLEIHYSKLELAICPFTILSVYIYWTDDCFRLFTYQSMEMCGAFSKMRFDVFCSVYVFAFHHLTVIEVLLSEQYSVYHFVLLIEIKSDWFVMLLILSWPRWENIEMKTPFIWINDIIAGKQNEYKTLSKMITQKNKPRCKTW